MAKGLRDLPRGGSGPRRAREEPDPADIAPVVAPIGRPAATQVADRPAETAAVPPQATATDTVRVEAARVVAAPVASAPVTEKEQETVESAAVDDGKGAEEAVAETGYPATVTAVVPDAGPTPAPPAVVAPAEEHAPAGSESALPPATPKKATAKKAAAKAAKPAGPVFRLPDDDVDPTWARQSVAAATRSAKRTPEEWSNRGVRFAEFAKRLLQARRNKDQKAAGPDRRIHENHYIEAALATVPATLDEARMWVNAYWDYLEEAGLPDKPATQTMSTRLRVETYNRANDVAENLRGHRYGMTGALYTAALLRLLHALDAADTEG